MFTLNYPVNRVETHDVTNFYTVPHNSINQISSNQMSFVCDPESAANWEKQLMLFGSYYGRAKCVLSRSINE